MPKWINNCKLHVTLFQELHLHLQDGADGHQRTHRYLYPAVNKTWGRLCTLPAHSIPHLHVNTDNMWALLYTRLNKVGTKF